MVGAGFFGGGAFAIVFLLGVIHRIDARLDEWERQADER